MPSTILHALAYIKKPTPRATLALLSIALRTSPCSSLIQLWGLHLGVPLECSLAHIFLSNFLSCHFLPQNLQSSHIEPISVCSSMYSVIYLFIFITYNTRGTVLNTMGICMKRVVGSLPPTS